MSTIYLNLIDFVLSYFFLIHFLIIFFDFLLMLEYDYILFDLFVVLQEQENQMH